VDSIEERRRAAVELGDALRRVMSAAAGSEGGVEEFAEATGLAATLAEILERSPRAQLQMPTIDDTVRNRRYYNPIRGLASPLSPPIEVVPTESGVESRFTLDLRYEGMPGFIHGGFLTMIFDEVFGVAMVKEGAWGMTAYLNTTYRRASPLHEELLMTGEVTRVEGRKTFLTGTLVRVAEPDVVLASAECLMVSPRPELARDYFGEVVDPSGERITALPGREDFGELGNG